MLHLLAQSVASGTNEPIASGVETSGTGVPVEPEAVARDAMQGFSQTFDSVGVRFGEFVEDPSVETALTTFGPLLLSLGQAIFALVVLVVIAMVAGRIVQNVSRRALERVRLEKTIVGFISRLTKYAVWIVAVPIAFEIFGIKTTSLAAVIGAAGLAIGLALQGSLSNIAAGIMLLFLRPIKVGDIVELDGEFGTVSDVGIFYTKLHTLQDRLIILPNSQVLSNKIENITESPEYRVDVPIGVAYGTDLRRALEVLNKVAKDNAVKYKGKMSDTVLTDFGDSSINLMVRVWCNGKDMIPVRSAVVLAIDEALKDAGITIPFPQRDLHVREPITILTNQQEKDD